MLDLTHVAKEIRLTGFIFSDEDSNVSWVSATSLSKFPLYEPAPSKKEDHPFNAARRWIAKKEGFSSWEEFEKAQQRIAPSLNKTPSFLGMRSGSVTTPLVSPITNANDSSDDSETDTSTRSPTSNVTEEELQAMQDTAGEIDGDSDYTGSDMDGTLGDEYFAWEHPEADGRPWAFYDLRNADCVNTGLPNSTHRNTPDATEAALSAHEIVEAARTQGDSYSEMKDSARELSPIGGFLKEAVEHPAEDNDVKTSSSTPMTSQNNTDVINHAAPLPEGGTVSAHTAQAHDENGAEGSLLTPLHTSTDLPRAAAAPLPPLPPPPVQSELEEVPKILKRMRSEEKTEMDSGTLGQDHAKKAKLTINTTNHGVVRPAVPDSDAARFFLPNVPLGPAAFELSFYSKGPLCWKRENEGSSIELYYGEGNRKVATVDGLLDIVIDPTKLRGFVKEEVPASNGNYMVTLLAMDPGDSPVQVVFDRAKGSKSDIGKIQLRSFLRWLWDVVPTLPLLERGENTGEVHLAQ
ncbi:hypothetical protein F5Y09DRAFT_341569 [Xylaria sp. FL1042]|nr:hypothetical protein F5Y09DRAFT_341569 [Xylaria sp. FL1042]